MDGDDRGHEQLLERFAPAAVRIIVDRSAREKWQAPGSPP
jgi:hypothetical protein